MGRGPIDDPTSLGNILIDWDVITPFQLGEALAEQASLTEEELIGRLLIAAGACTESELEAAVKAQRAMRGADRGKSALACADLAMKRHRRKSLVTRRENLIQQGEEVTKSISGSHPVLVDHELDNPEDS